MIIHHPDEEILLDYAAGTLPEALALVVATHVSMCSRCLANVRLVERCGSALLENTAGADLSANALEDILRRLDISEPVERQQIVPVDSETAALLPSPLRRYVSKSLGELSWRRVGRLYEEYRLPVSRHDVKAALYRLPAGCLMPKHSHSSQEYTVVLAGEYRDEKKRYGRGDFSALDASDSHQPIVSPGMPCLCLVALDAPVKLSGAFGMLVNPFLRI